jgi:hypothetical protein
MKSSTYPKILISNHFTEFLQCGEDHSTLTQSPWSRLCRDVDLSQRCVGGGAENGGRWGEGHDEVKRFKGVLLNRQISELTTDRWRDSIRFWQNNSSRSKLTPI